MLAGFLPDFWRCLNLEIICEKMRNICNGSGVSKDSSLADSPLRWDAEIPIISTLRAQIPAGAWWEEAADATSLLQQWELVRVARFKLGLNSRVFPSVQQKEAG
jgi:hypothetical protein